jgi:ADP-heptose:LPS heptosyltransferase
MPSLAPNILVIKYSALGDLVFITPMLKALREGYPTSKITLLTYSWVVKLVPCIHDVDEVMVYDVPIRISIRGIFEIIRLMYRLRAVRPEIVIVGNRNSIFGLLAYVSGARYRLGFTSTRFLTHSTPFISYDHEVDRYLSIVSTIGIQTNNKNTSLKILEEDLKTLDNKLFTDGLSLHTPLIVVFPGGGENPLTSMVIKRWSQDRYREVIKRILGVYSYSVVLIGSEQEKSMCGEIAAYLDHVVNFAGKLTFQEIVALGRYCRLFIGGDSGPTHLIAATGAPTITLFGPSDPRLVAPRGKQQLYIWTKPPCAPCYTPETVKQQSYFQGRTFICHTGTHECMQSLTIDDVWEKITGILAPGEEA